jgi:hypothetical protein
MFPSDEACARLVKSVCQFLSSFLKTRLLGQALANYYPLQGDPRFEALLNDPTNDAPLFRAELARSKRDPF